MTDISSPEELKKALEKTKTFLHSKVPKFPKVGVVLGSGWGAFVDRMKSSTKIAYQDIPGFYAPTVKGHGGHLVFGQIENVDVVVMQGRIHYYEGHPMERVV